MKSYFFQYYLHFMYTCTLSLNENFLSSNPSLCPFPTVTAPIINIKKPSPNVKPSTTSQVTAGSCQPFKC